jgi:predicted phage terminase large subunit-like protein
MMWLPKYPTDIVRLTDAALRVDLYSFIQGFHPIVSPGDMFLPNWHIEAIAYALTRVMRGEITRLIITMPPRCLKSFCTSVAFPAFVLGHDPTRRFICVSYAENLAHKHANDCRAIIRSNRFRRIFTTRISPFKDTESEVMTNAGGFRLATSVGGTLTGRGANFIIIDDPMKPQDAQSASARESEKQWLANTLLSRLDNKARDALVFVMQRLHTDDLVGHVLEQHGHIWTHLNLPAIAEVEEHIPLGPGRFHVRRPGDLLHPEREPQEILDQIKVQMGSADFEAQYQQRPVPPGGALIKWPWFRFHEKCSVLPDDRIIVSWDTAMSSSELSGYSVCIIGLVRGGSVFILHVIRDRLEYPALKRKVIEVHEQWRHASRNYALLIENKGSGTCLIQDLRQHHIHAIAIQPDGDKIMRMNRQTARMEAGSVSVPSRAPWLSDFRSEAMAFPHGRYNDQVDALSQLLDRAFNYRPNYPMWGTW